MASTAATFDAMRDSDIAALLADGDTRGLELAYSAYADRIHDYARGMLRNASPEAAADVTHDTFLIALAKAPDLRDRDKLRPWLYAIARNECLRVIRASRRTTVLPDDPDTAEGSDEMSTGIAASERRALVLAAAEGLAPKDREVFDLSLRHDLSARDVASALGVSDNAAHAMLSRVRSAFETSLGALLVARQGRGTCAGLNEMLADWDGTYDALWRKRIARHVTSCSACQKVERRELSPAALLAVMPLLPAPVLVRSRLLEDELELVSADLLARARALAERAGPWDLEGFPGTPPARRRLPALWAVAAVLLLILGVFQSVRLIIRDVDGPVASPTVATRTTSPSPTDTHGLAGQPTLLPRPSKTPSPSATTASASPTPTTTAPSPTPTVVVTPTPPVTLTPPPPPAPGRLSVTPRSFDVFASSAPQTVTVRLTAVGGAVDWTLRTTRLAPASPTSGSLARGASTTVTITIPDGSTGPATRTVTFSPGNIVVTINIIRPQ